MHISSIPSPYGIGTLGKSARKFLDFLRSAGQSYWQILPVCPTGYGDSPYQGTSTYAGNPYLIDLDMLQERGLLEKADYSELNWGEDEGCVDFGKMYELRNPVLAKAADRLLEQPPGDYSDFCENNKFWLDDYALFSVIKEVCGGLEWQKWSEGLKFRKDADLQQFREAHGGEIEARKAVQYMFFDQWNSLREYARETGIRIIGDAPIYVAMDSVDVWVAPEMFRLDEELRPTEISGCPPDGFSATGQRWGNPLYRWDRMAVNNYEWAVRRFGYLSNIYDVLRIDHFRGFDSYYAIPADSPDARTGTWEKGPGAELFKELERRRGKVSIIAEDLGFLTDSVRELLEECGYPGMKVLQFAFDSREPSHVYYLPHRYPERCVAYTGTHDNNTIKGWISEISKEEFDTAKQYMGLSDPDSYVWDTMKTLWRTAAGITIVPMQDILCKGSEARMNRPAIPEGNWAWRMKKDEITDDLVEKLHGYMEMYERI